MWMKLRKIWSSRLAFFAPLAMLIIAFAGRTGHAQIAQTVLRVHGNTGKTVQQGADGLTWGNAFKYLQDALAQAPFEDPPIEIRVAGSPNASDTWRVYKPDEDSDSGTPQYPTTGAKALSFDLIANVRILGQFNGSGANPDSRNPANLTFLSGDIDEDGLIDGDNSEVVVLSEGSTPGSELNGFIIEFGNGTATNHAGGIYLDGGTSLIRKCVIRNNKGNLGGGCSIAGGFGDPFGPREIVECIIVDNVAESTSGNARGGGIRISLSEGRPLVMVNTIIRNNTSQREGGGVWCASISSVSYTNCLIVGNSTDGKGGGMWQSDEQAYTMTNSTVSENSAGGDGGGLYQSGQPGGLAGPEVGEHIIHNSIFWNNVECLKRMSTSNNCASCVRMQL